MQYKYLILLFFVSTLLACNKADDLFNDEFIVEKANGNIHRTMKDERDGKIYATIVVDSLEWMNENLQYNKNGDSKFIFCPEDEDGNEHCDYGKLYDFSRSYCPDGWKKPTKEQWTALAFFFLDGGIEDIVEHMEYGGYNFQYAGGGYDRTNDASFVEFFDFKSVGFFIAEDNYFWWVDSIGNSGIDNASFVDFASCRCVRKFNPTDSPFFDECSDGIMNGDETGVDCGGSECDPCPPSCGDGVMNGDETGIDCGGTDCAPCPLVFTDPRDGQEYGFAVLGEQTWMTENLNFSGAGVCYDNLESNCDIYGRLYNYDEVSNQSICPQGWHVPSDDEFKELESYLGMPDEDLDESGSSNGRGSEEKIGDQLKTENWQSSSPAVPLSGFNAIPGGWRNNTVSIGINQATYFTTSSMITNPSGDKVIFRYLYYTDAGIVRGGIDVDQRISCRCLKD